MTNFFYPFNIWFKRPLWNFKKIDRSEVVTGMFLDLTKAFDGINHKILGSI